MGWWGKLVGGAFGFMLGGPLGAVLGAALGHNLDKGLGEMSGGAFAPGEQERVQTAFFTATFSVLGHLAKADGRVSEDEISYARAVMAHLELSPDLKKAAIRLFNTGKQQDFPIDEVLAQFRTECHGRGSLVRMFMEILIQGAYADGAMHAGERRVLRHACRILGISEADFDRLDAMIRAGMHAHAGGDARSRKTGADMSLSDACAILGVSPDDSMDTIRKAYRRLLNQHHPDKLVARGLPEEMMKLAAEKTHEIRMAWERIRDARAS